MAEGLHPKVVAELLGHASITLTLGVYSHVLPGMREQAAAKLEKVIFG
jgi:integrase